PPAPAPALPDESDQPALRRPDRAEAPALRGESGARSPRGGVRPAHRLTQPVPASVPGPNGYRWDPAPPAGATRARQRPDRRGHLLTSPPTRVGRDNRRR